jgi:1,2-diacylglycerol 3-beta-galactosyltransferase
MATLQVRKPRITFLFSDTGGGHRAASEAIIDAIHCEYGDSIVTQMVDFLKEYAPLPFNHLPEAYPGMAKNQEIWKAMFETSNGPSGVKIVTNTFWPMVRKAAYRLMEDYRNDLLVSVHPLATSFGMKALDGRNRPPFITVVTDLVTGHALWFNQQCDLTIVPTEMARQLALSYSLSPEKVRVTGMPILLKCDDSPEKKPLIRERLGWMQEKLTVLLVGGGEGMGPLNEMASAINDSDLDVSLVIVTGRNTKLEAELREWNWKKPTRIYGFTHEMQAFMQAADVIVTKAGPGTIAEAMAAALPIILYAKIPGQEDGNVDYVLEEEVGVWAPDPALVIHALRKWVNRPEERERISKNCRRAAHPDASRQIAHILGDYVRFDNWETSYLSNRSYYHGIGGNLSSLP